MRRRHSERAGGKPDQELWEATWTAYLAKVSGRAPSPGSIQRIEAARASLAAVTRGSTTVVDLYIDPVCPYTWVVACWLREVGRLREVDVRYHAMSLHLLNAGGVLQETYRAKVGPSRVAMAVAQHHGPEALRVWHPAFGDRVFDHWRYPSPREYRTATLDALAAAGLPTDLAAVAATDEYDDALRRITDEAILPVGVDAGTPVLHVDGAAFFGPLLNAVPRGAAALRLFESLRMLAGSPDFYELKRTRTSPPDVSYRPEGDDGRRTHEPR